MVALVSQGSRQQRRIALLVVVALAVALFGISLNAPAKATPGFGAFDATNGAIDTPVGTVGTRTLAQIGDQPSGSTDDSYSGGGPKENDPCPSVSLNHSAPPKADIQNFYYGTDSSAPGVLYLAWTRKSATGSLTVDFELNKSTTACANGINPTRSQGDVLVTYDFQGGTTIGIEVRTWDVATAMWVLRGDVPAAHEQSIATDQSSGELAINLVDFHILDTSASAPCTTFASGWAKTRTGSTSAFDTSTVKDFIKPVTTNVSNCGSVEIIKDARPNDAQAFAFTSSSTEVGATFSLSDPGSGTSNTTGALQVHPGSFTVTEGAEPSPWTFTGVTCSGTGTHSESGTVVTANIGASQSLVCTYVNTKPNTITITKNASVKTGHSFAFTATGAGVSNFNLVDNGTTASTANTTSFPNLASGSYSFSETASTGWSLAGIDCGAATVTYGNPPHSPFAAGDTRVNITLTNGDSVACTYANAKTLPTISVTKTPTPSSVPEPGGNVSFAVHVTNTSPLVVTTTDLADSIYGDIASAANPAIVSTTCATGVALAANGGTYDCSFVAPVTGNAGTVHHDTVTVTGTDSDGVEVHNSASADVRVTDVLPQIGITKAASASTVHSGDPVAYTYAVTNPGVEPLLDVTVTDDKCTPVVVVSGDTNADGKLDTNETWRYTCTSVLLVTTTNVATARGHDDEGNNVSSTATATVVVINPAILVKKTPDAVSVTPGTTVTYTYVVTNPGDAALTSVSLVDDKCSPATFVGGDLNGDNALQPGEIWTYRCAQVQTGDPSTLTNIATASGTDPLGKKVLSTDKVTVAVVAPEVLVKAPAAAPLVVAAPVVETPAAAPVTLPRTGTNVVGLLQLAASLLLLGLALVGVTRRRRTV